MECSAANVSTQVCYCPKGYYDYACSTSTYTKCYLNITNPPFYKGCSEEPDSEYYMFSISGYDPCPDYKIDFAAANGFDLTYLLVC
jgi:hypothetical protein